MTNKTALKKMVEAVRKDVRKTFKNANDIKVQLSSWLIDENSYAIYDDPGDFIYDILWNGGKSYKGYDNMTVDEILTECAEAHLGYPMNNENLLKSIEEFKYFIEGFEDEHEGGGGVPNPK